MKSRFFKCVLSTMIIFLLCFLVPVKAEISKDFSGSQYSKTVSMDFQEANLRDVLKIFSQQSGMNFIASQAVQDRKVTLYLDAVPVEEALEKILGANNLTYEIQEGSNIFVVKESGKPAVELITKVFYLKYASVSTSRISREIINSIVSSAGNASFSGQSPSTSGEALGIKEALLKIVSDKGKVSEDSRTNSLTITDVVSQFPIIEQTIARLDIPLPQVMIEVQMLDVTKNTAEQLGVKIGQTPATFQGGTHTTGFPFDTAAIAKRGLTPTYTLGTLSLTGLTAALEFLTTKTDTKYLARPKLFTLSNQTAEIKIVTQEAIGLKTSTQSSEGSATQTAEAERAETGVSLRVTPQVNPETGEITMYVEPRVSQAKTGGTFSTGLAGGGSVTFKDPEERGTKSVVRIMDGETIMVGGLIRTDFTQTLTKVPFLGDIPFLGAAFRHKNISKNEDRELIVFITPRIVKEASKSLVQSLNIDREQGMPLAKSVAIEKTLADFEKKRR